MWVKLFRDIADKEFRLWECLFDKNVIVECYTIYPLRRYIGRIDPA